MAVEILIGTTSHDDGVIESPQEDENFEYSYRQKGNGFLAIKGDADGLPFALTIQTLGFLLGRDNVDADEIPFVGCHAKAIHKSHRWIITILRPAGFPSFDEQAWTVADLTRVGFCGLKKLSRSHLLVHPAVKPSADDGTTTTSGWQMTSLSTNGVTLETGERLADGKTRLLDQETKVVLCAGLVKLQISI